MCVPSPGQMIRGQRCDSPWWPRSQETHPAMAAGEQFGLETGKKWELQHNRKWEKWELGGASGGEPAPDSTDCLQREEHPSQNPKGEQTPKRLKHSLVPHLCQLKLHEGEPPVLLWREASEERSGAARTHRGENPLPPKPGPRGRCSPPGHSPVS